MTQPQNINTDPNVAPIPEASRIPEAVRINMANQEYEDNKKSFGVAFALWWLTGVIGGHRYYLGDTGIGIGMTFTLGGLAVWALVDVFFISGRVKQVNDKKRREVNMKYGLPALPIY